MYQFHSGFSSINNFVVATGGVTAGQPVKFASTKIDVAETGAIVGVATSTVAAAGYVGFQAGGVLGTSMINGADSRIAVGDELEVTTGGIFVKLDQGTAVATALTAVATDMSGTDDEDIAAGLVELPMILLK
jgi:hypothetical protein